MNDTCFDVIVIGGGSAGLSGGLTLARARRSVLVLDAGEPRNAPAAAIHGLLTRDGLPPGDLVELGSAEIVRYGGTVRRARATSAHRDGEVFVVRVEAGEEYTARRLLVASGLVDELPEIPGLRERWGRDVLHCPYCHGWEVRDEPIGVLGGGPYAVHQAMLFRQWSDDVTLLLHAAPDPTPEEWEQLAARGIGVVDGEVVAIEIDGDRLAGVRLAGGQVVARRALAVLPRFAARDEVLAELDLPTVDDPRGLGCHVEVDASGLTAVPGVWAAGNVTDLTAGVVGALAAGVTAGAAINADLVAEDTRRAVDHRRLVAATVASPSTFFSAAAEARTCERVLAQRRHGLGDLV